MHSLHYFAYTRNRLRDYAFVVIPSIIEGNSNLIHQLEASFGNNSDTIQKISEGQRAYYIYFRRTAATIDTNEVIDRTGRPIELILGFLTEDSELSQFDRDIYLNTEEISLKPFIEMYLDLTANKKVRMSSHATQYKPTIVTQNHMHTPDNAKSTFEREESISARQLAMPILWAMAGASLGALSTIGAMCFGGEKFEPISCLKKTIAMTHQDCEDKAK